VPPICDWPARRRGGEEEGEPDTVEAEEGVTEEILAPERAAALEEAEQFLLTVTDGGFGKRSSAYEYRVTGRGGQGFANITLSPRTGMAVAGTFVVRPGDDVMLVTDAGRLIRLPADSLKVRGRTTMGVTLFRLDNGERVTSVFPVVEAATQDEADAPLADGGDE
jgi:DNA gyrase subunit A